MRALRVGFDVIEVHGVHGSLISSFLSPTSKDRTDGYGGGFVSRARLVLEVIGLATARQSSALSAPPASSGGIYMNENQAGAMARLMQRVEDMQREFDNTRAEMAAMSSELRAVKTASGTCAATFVTCN